MFALSQVLLTLLLPAVSLDCAYHILQAIRATLPIFGFVAVAMTAKERVESTMEKIVVGQLFCPADKWCLLTW